MYGDNCIEKFSEHYEAVRRAVPKVRLLEWEVQDGWEPLCKFLQVDELEEPFPLVYDSKALVGAHFMMRDTAAYRSFINVLRYGSAVWGR